MSKSNQFTSRATHRRNTALIGLAVVFVILLLINFLAGKMSLRADLTEYNTYTLSEGTENILNGLDTPVEIRFYVTDDSKVMSPGERTRVRRVELPARAASLRLDHRHVPALLLWRDLHPVCNPQLRA